MVTDPSGPEPPDAACHPVVLGVEGLGSLAQDPGSKGGDRVGRRRGTPSSEKAPEKRLARNSRLLAALISRANHLACSNAAATEQKGHRVRPVVTPRLHHAGGATG